MCGFGGFKTIFWRATCGRGVAFGGGVPVGWGSILGRAGHPGVGRCVVVGKGDGRSLEEERDLRISVYFNEMVGPTLWRFAI